MTETPTSWLRATILDAGLDAIADHGDRPVMTQVVFTPTTQRGAANRLNSSYDSIVWSEGEHRHPQMEKQQFNWTSGEVSLIQRVQV